MTMKLSISEYILAGSLSLLLDYVILIIFKVEMGWTDPIYWISNTIVFMIIWGNTIWYMSHIKSNQSTS